MPSIIRHSDNGKTLTLSVGDLFSIELEENPTTGYLWTIYEIDEAVVRSLGSRFLSSHSGLPSKVGAGGIVILDFLANLPGTTSIRLKRERKGRSTDRERETFAIMVNVKKKEEKISA